MREWSRLSVRAEAPDVAELHVFDEIGQSFWTDNAVTAAAVVSQLNALPASVTTIRVRVNSPGGDVFDAITIANALKAQRDEHGRTVEARIEGLAASAATIITSAANPILIAPNALMMIHRPHSMSYGESDEHRRSADALDKIEQAIITTYQQTSTKSAEELAAMMKAETWMSAEEAVRDGFATKILEEDEEVDGAIAACFRPQSMRALGAIPQRFAAKLRPLVRQPEPVIQPAAHADVMRLCSAAGLDLTFAQGLVEARAPLADVQARIAGEATARKQEADRVQHIRAACALVRLPMLADNLVAGGISLDATKRHLAELTALLDPHEIDGSISPDAPSQGGGGVDYSGMWKRAFAKANAART